VVVSAVLPLLESIFKCTTDIKLLELASLNHPLLRQLIMQAPGTYTHTLRVADLASAAAETIGADPLLARVGAYYHDIGKIAKPEYFVENQAGRGNKHDRLSPSMSALIIMAHVKDGIKLAKEYKLPQRIIDMIPQHHGTNLISYFYNRLRSRKILPCSRSTKRTIVIPVPNHRRVRRRSSCSPTSRSGFARLAEPTFTAYHRAGATPYEQHLHGWPAR
jgi:putative nucleotidyltransferase with HDIG domain